MTPRRLPILFLCGLLILADGAGPGASAAPAPPPATPRVIEADAAVAPTPIASDDEQPPRVHPIAVPLPSAGIGGLVLLSLMMFRRWFRRL